MAGWNCAQQYSLSKCSLNIRFGAALFGQKELGLKTPAIWCLLFWTGGMSRGISFFKTHDFILSKPQQSQASCPSAGLQTTGWNTAVEFEHNTSHLECFSKIAVPTLLGVLSCWPTETNCYPTKKKGETKGEWQHSNKMRMDLFEWFL